MEHVVNKIFIKELEQQKEHISKGEPIPWIEGSSKEDYVRSAVRTALRMGAKNRSSIMNMLKALHLQSFTTEQVENALIELEQMKEIKVKGKKTYSWVGIYK